MYNSVKITQFLLNPKILKFQCKPVKNKHRDDPSKYDFMDGNK